MDIKELVTLMRDTFTGDIHVDAAIAKFNEFIEDAEALKSNTLEKIAIHLGALVELKERQAIVFERLTMAVERLRGI